MRLLRVQKQSCKAVGRNGCFWPEPAVDERIGLKFKKPAAAYPNQTSLPPTMLRRMLPGLQETLTFEFTGRRGFSRGPVQ